MTDYQADVDQDDKCASCGHLIRAGDYFTVDYEGVVKHQRIPGYAGDVLSCGNQYDPATGEFVGAHFGWEEVE